MATRPQAATVGYWRFEEGPAGALVYNNPNHYSADSSGNGNHGYSFSVANSASYDAAVPLDIIPWTGAGNQFSLYTGPGGTVRDLYTIGPINTTSFPSFTIEVSVSFDGLGSWQTFVGRDANFSPLAALYFQLVQDAGRENHVAIKAMDSGLNLRTVFSRDPVMTGQWYHWAAVADSAAHTLRLFRLDEASEHYVEEGTAVWNGPLQSQGWSWTLGRGMFDGQVTDALNGRIDEIRISNTALATNELLWSWGVPRAVAITTHPADATVHEGADATFSVEVSGQPPFTYQWFKDDQLMVGATNALYTLSGARTNDQGTAFKVAASNVTSGQTNVAVSQSAHLTVLPDHTPPTLLLAQYLGDPQRLILTFDEDLDPATALVTSHYAISEGVVVSSVAFGADGRTIVLHTSPMPPDTTLNVFVNEVRDRSAAANVIAPNTSLPLSAGYTPLYRDGQVALLREKPEPLGPCSRRTALAISEIHYHPAARADGRNAEFIEFYNSQPWPEDIGGFHISGSVDYTFPPNTTIAATGFVVVAAAPADVQALYGLDQVWGPFDQTNALPNDAGVLRLRHRTGAVLLEVEYADDPPWPVAPDGSGHTLVLARPSLGERDPRAWGVSRQVGGSPGSREPDASPGDTWQAVVLNEILAHPSPGGLDFVELFNYSTQAVDLTGCVLTDDLDTNKFVFPPGSVLGPLGFVALQQDQLGFGLKAGGDTVWFFNPDRTCVLQVVRFSAQEQGVSLGRYPDAAPGLRRLETVTLASPNTPTRISDIVFSEILYHPISGDADDEFVELHNRSSNAVDISGWRLEGGVSYGIPTPTQLAGGGYLVVARDAARLSTNYAHLNTQNLVGNFNGQLNNRGESIALAKPIPNISTNAGQPVTNILYAIVDEVFYRDGGRWGQWSDGGGSSLEVVDARAPSHLAPSWADSDESAKSGWKNIEASGVLDHGMGNADSLQILLLGPGECLVDDVEVIPSEGGNRVINSSFEAGLAGWAFQGSHARSSWETRQGYNSARSLHLVATDRGDTGANRVRTTLSAPLEPGQSATIRARVKWLRGAPEILLRLRGNWLEAPGYAPTSHALGTPGLPNSRATANGGPAITDVSHWPVLPASGQAVTVVARVADPDGLSSATLIYRLDPGTNRYALPMQYRGAGWFSAELPGQAAGSLAAFFLAAADANSPPATARFPAQAPQECLVRWGEPEPDGVLGAYRLWMTAAALEEWSRREKLSNDPLDGTFAYGDFRVIYNLGAQFSGSPWHSQFYDTPIGNWCNYQLLMPADDRLLGADDFRIVYPGNDNDDPTAQREQFGLWLCEQLGLPFNHHRYVHFFVNGLRRGTILEDAQGPDGDFLEEFFPDTPGHLLKVSMWHEFQDNAASYVVTPASIQDFTTTGGAKKLARYRWTFPKRAVQDSFSDYTNFFGLVDAANWPLDRVISRLDALADTENWMRMFAFQHAVGNWDSWGNGNGQNIFLFGPEEGRWQCLPFDADILLGTPPSDSPTSDLFKCQDPVLAGLYTVPAYHRAYWRALLELAEGPFSSAAVNARLDPREAGLRANGAAVTTPQPVKDFIATRRAYILAQSAAVASPFTVSGPTNFSALTNLVTLSGTAPVEVRTLQVNGLPVAVNWTTVSNWNLRVPLQPGVANYTVQGLNQSGQPVLGANAVFTIDYTGGEESPVGLISFNEIMFAPSWPGAEYVELFNASTHTTFDLSGWRINGLDYTFPAGAFIAPGQFLVLAKDRVAYWNAYDMATPLFDQYNGNLQSDGETLTLIKPGATPDLDRVVDRVTYAGTPPWPAGGNGEGASLQLIDPTQDNSRVGNWSDNSAAWQFVSLTANIGNVSRFTKFSLYFDNGGEVFLDDLALVSGAVPAVGINYLENGDFESALTPPWTVTGLATNSAIDESVSHGGGASLHFVNAAASGSVNHFFQQLTNVVPQGPTPNTVHTLSFWYLAGGTGTLNLYVNAAFRTNLNLGAGSAASARLTPGTTNSVRAVFPPIPPIFLSEVQPLNLTGPADNFGEREPWIELHNASTETVSLDNCYLAGQLTHLLQWAFPTGSVIRPDEHLLVWADGESAETAGSNWHANFQLSPTNGAVALSRAFSNSVFVLDYLSYGSIPPDLSYGAWPADQTSYRQIFHYPTPRAANNPLSPPATLFLNEWMAANNRAFADPADGDFDDWFEIFNPGADPVDLEGFFLSDSLANPQKFVVPAGVVVPAHGYLLVWADEESSQTQVGGDLHVNFKLAQDGELISLLSPDGTSVDRVIFSAQTNNVSQGRYPDGGPNLYFMTLPTPRAANQISQPAPSPELVDLRLDSYGLLTFSFVGLSGYRYQVEHTPDLVAPNWMPLGPPHTGSGALVIVSDPVGPGPSRFYRVVVLP